MRLQNPIRKQEGVTGRIVGGGVTGGGAEIVLETDDGEHINMALDGPAYESFMSALEEAYADHGGLQGVSIIGQYVTVHGEESGRWFEFGPPTDWPRVG